MKRADVEKYLSSVSKNFVGAFEEISQESHAEEFLDLVDTQKFVLYICEGRKMKI